MYWQATRYMRPPGGGKAPERVPQAIACRLHRLLSPRFDDPCVEASYLQFAARGSEAVQRFFALTISVSQAMLLASQAAWAAWSGQEFSAGFELCKLLLLLAMLYLGVRRSDEARRREFATRAPQRHGHAAAPQAARSAAPASARAAAALRDREVGALGPPLARPVVPVAVGQMSRGAAGQRSRGVRGVIMRGVITRGLMRGKSDVARPLVDPPPTGHAARPPPSPTPSSTLAPSAPPSPPSPALTPSPPSPLAPPSPPQPPPSPSLPPKASSSAPSLPGAPPRTLPPVSLANGTLAAGAVASGEVLGAALRTLTLTPTLTLTLNPNPNPNLNPNPNPNPNGSAPSRKSCAARCASSCETSDAAKASSPGCVEGVTP